MNGFLYGQTEYNLLKNSIHLSNYISSAVKNGFDFLSITDENMYGHLKFYRECKKNNIKPIIGLEVKINSHDSFDNIILLYALNNNGFHNLLKISSLLKLKKDIQLGDLQNVSKDLVLISAGQNSDINRMLCNNLIDEFNLRINEYKNIFGNIYIGIDNQRYNSLEKNKFIEEYCIENKIDFLPVHQTLYFEYADKDVYESLTKIDGKPKNINQDDDFSFPNMEVLNQEFTNPQFSKNLTDFIKNINITIDKQEVKLPTYPNTNGLSSKTFLEGMCLKGLEKRLLNINVNKKPYYDRLIYELSVINKMDYNDYFLIVWDFVKYAKKNQILVGPGRGSAAGSLVSFCLGITNVDPIKYDLLFERFLNPERISMPDIDMDFPDDRRDEVITYVQDLYGKNRVCNISAYGTFLVKSSIRDLGRVLKISSQRLDILIKMSESITDTNELLEKVKENPEIYNLLRIARKIENLPRHVSTHAAGIILSQESLFDIVPLQEGINGLYQSQLEATDLESMGLLKIDFLGIRNLSIINNTINEIKVIDQKSLNNIPLDDKKTFELFKRADTLGVFQLESDGIKKVLKKLQPNTFEDIVAVLALYRPGPMDNIDEFVDRKNGKKFEYIHPKLKDILHNTYGIIVYQEQIMKIATAFAGYRLGEADLLRRAVSKKDENTLLKERQKFVSRSIEQGYNEIVANQIYDYIVKFANYGFNRSHSVAYALVSYQMAYLKANYFPVFMTKIMNNVIGSQSALASYINYASKNNLKVLKPSINASTTEFYITQYGLFFPLQGIFSIGEVLAKEILEERKKGLFKSFGDFKKRMPSINSRVLESLIYAGAFDIFGKTKKELIDNSDVSTETFDKFLDDVKDFKEEFDFSHLKEKEFTSLGINIEYNVFRDIKSLISKHRSQIISQLKINSSNNIVGIFEQIKVITTKNNEKMALLTFNDGYQDIDAVLFSNEYNAFQDVISKDTLFLINAMLVINNKTNKNQLKINSIKKI